jgi:hypothetical protein
LENPQNAPITSKTNLQAEFKFGLDIMNFKIYEKEEEMKVPASLYDYNNLNLTQKSMIYISESNMGIIIFHYPFNFIIYRKEVNHNETIFDSRTFLHDDQNNFFYESSLKQIHSRLNHTLFGIVK